jgi:integrase
MQIGNVKRCFKWAASRELIPPSVFHGLQAVDGLRRGKCDARETDPVKPVPEEWVEATIERGRLSRQVEGLIRLQLASGMRPGEAVIMRGCDIDAAGDVWNYTPTRHKTQHHGHERAIFLGPLAKAVVQKFLKPDVQAFLFSPADAERERRDALTAARKTPLSCGNTIGTNRRRRCGKEPGERYTVSSYYRAIIRACDEAFPPPTELARLRMPANGRKAKTAKRWETAGEWRTRLGPERWAELLKWREEHRWHPHQLRHSAATRLRRQFGLEAARVILGHKSAAVAEVYAEIDQDKARKIMGEVG